MVRRPGQRLLVGICLIVGRNSQGCAESSQSVW